MRRRPYRAAELIAAAVVCGLTTLLVSPIAVAADLEEDRRAASTPTADGNAEVRALQLGSGGAPVRSSGGTVSCQFIEIGEERSPFGYGGIDGQIAGPNPAAELIEGWWYYVACTYDGVPGKGRFFQHEPGQLPIDPVFLALEAVDTLTIAYPTPSTSPPTDLQQLVGLPTWLWIDPDGYQPATATASIPGLTVTATATPTQITWNMGDGTEPIICNTPGTPYDTAIPDDQQTTDCSHTYQHAGPYTAQATVDWTINWTATNGNGGTLPNTTRTTTFDLDVIERQAVIIDNP